jgi:hypothetical protein
MCFLLGCQSPAEQSHSSAKAPTSDNGLGLDEEIGERAEPGEAGTDQPIADTIADTIAGYINCRYFECAGDRR